MRVCLLLALSCVALVVVCLPTSASAESDIGAACRLECAQSNAMCLRSSANPRDCAPSNNRCLDACAARGSYNDLQERTVNERWRQEEAEKKKGNPQYDTVLQAGREAREAREKEAAAKAAAAAKRNRPGQNYYPKGTKGTAPTAAAPPAAKPADDSEQVMVCEVIQKGASGPPRFALVTAEHEVAAGSPRCHYVSRSSAKSAGLQLPESKLHPRSAARRAEIAQAKLANPVPLFSQSGPLAKLNSQIVKRRAKRAADAKKTRKTPAAKNANHAQAANVSAKPADANNAFKAKKNNI